MLTKSLTALLRGVCVGIVVLCTVQVSSALESSNVLVLYNSASSDGADIASYYAKVHPGVLTLALDNVPTTEQISWDVYLNTIRPQVLAALDDSIDCIVTTKGLPLRIDNPSTGGSWSRYSSLESELARVDSINSRSLMGNQNYILPDMWGGNSLALNPYAFQNGPFDYQTYGIRLTSRLDGFSVADVTTAIDRAQGAVINGPGFSFVIDDDPNAPASSVDRMKALAAILGPAGVPYNYDATDAFISDAPGSVIGYVSHGVHGGAPAGYVLDEQNGLAFDIAPGAAFHTWESFNAYSFERGANRDNQGLIAEWIHRGGSVGTGHVEEPGVGTANTTNEDRMFQMLLDGYTWAEAAWNATLQLSYVNTVVGDPLMVYELLPPPELGDFDGDGDVDGVDFGFWQMNFPVASGASLADGDADGDGDVDGVDFALWQMNYTTSVEGTTMTTTPEPATLLVMALAGLLMLFRSRSRLGRES